jgi:hypothetical protein
MDYSKLKKLEATNHPLKNLKSNQMLEAIIKVKQENYIPKNIKVRSKISDFLFTTEFKAEFLKNLENDPLIHSISVNQKLALIDPINDK